MAMQNATVGAGRKAVLQTSTMMKAIPWEERCQDLPVLVRITAPSRRAHRLDLDVVLIPFNESSGTGTTDASLRAYIELLIERLRPQDRLSWLGNRRFTDLTEMSGEGREAASRWASQLTPATSLHRWLKPASQILKNSLGNSNRVGCVIVVMTSQAEPCCNIEFPLYIICPLTTDSRTEVESNQRMQLELGKKPITYYFVRDDPRNFKRTIALCISELKSVTAREIKIHLEANTGDRVNISSIESGGFKSEISVGNGSGTIEIDYLCDNEKKNFIVHLVVPKRTDMLMTVSGKCKDNTGEIRLHTTEVVVQRPRSSNEIEMCPQVAAELIRLQLVKCVSPMLRHHISKETRARLWNDIINSEYARIASRSTSCLSKFKEDIDKMGIHMFLPIWLALQKWQRASTKTLLSLLAAEVQVYTPEESH